MRKKINLLAAGRWIVYITLSIFNPSCAPFNRREKKLRACITGEDRVHYVTDNEHMDVMDGTQLLV